MRTICEVAPNEFEYGPRVHSENPEFSLSRGIILALLPSEAMHQRVL